MNISIITVAYKSRENLERLLNSIEKAKGNLKIEHFIIDNASNDGAREFVEKNFPEVKFIQNKENVGFGMAHNQVMNVLKGDFILCLNPDMKLEEGSLPKIYNWLKSNPKTGLVSVKLVDENNKVNLNAGPRIFPTVLDQLAIIFKIPHFLPTILNHYLMIGFDYEKEQNVDSVRGSFMFLRREIVDKLGFIFDPRYFIWFEDVDLCREVKKMGFEVTYTPIISAVDYIGQSFKQKTTLWKQKNFTASMVKYFEKWESGPKTFLIKLARPIGIFFAYLMEKIKF
jgi:GT2 family glycosyltransferase